MPKEVSPGGARFWRRSTKQSAAWTEWRAKSGHRVFNHAAAHVELSAGIEAGSIAEADIFGEHLFGESDEPFDSSEGNPFASHLRRLAADLECPGIVEVERDGLRYGSPWPRLPDYDLCNDELESITNGSTDARRALETGHVRLSEIPEQLKGKHAGEERAAWLEERLPDTYKGLEEGQPLAEWAKFEATATPGEVKEVLKKVVSESGPASRNDGGAEEDGDMR